MKNFRRLDLLIILLLVAGWIIPSIQTHYGVALASTGLRDPQYYWNYVCVGNLGYFSGSVLVEDTLEEGSHGHSFPVGACIPANALSVFVPLSAIVSLFVTRSRKSLLRLWQLIAVALALMGIFLSYTSWQFPTESILLALVFIGFEMSMAARKYLAKKHDGVVVDVLVRHVLLFYPIWILALALTQKVSPSWGLALTAAGCFLLAVRKDNNSVVSTTITLEGKTE